MTETLQTPWTHGALRNPTPPEPEASRGVPDEIRGPDWLRQLGAVQFTQVVSDAYRQQGYQVQFVEKSAHGVDLVLLRGSDRILVTFEHHRIAESGLELVRRLDQAVTAQSATWGIAITACAFTQEAQEFAETTRITVLDGEAVAQLLSIGPIQPATPIPPPNRRIPTSPATAIPSCPVCRTAMVLHAGDGPHDPCTWACQKCTEAPSSPPPRSISRDQSDDEQWQGALGRWRQLSNR